MVGVVVIEAMGHVARAARTAGPGQQGLVKHCSERDSRVEICRVSEKKSYSPIVAAMKASDRCQTRA